MNYFQCVFILFMIMRSIQTISPSAAYYQTNNTSSAIHEDDTLQEKSLRFLRLFSSDFRRKRLISLEKRAADNDIHGLTSNNTKSTSFLSECYFSDMNLVVFKSPVLFLNGLIPIDSWHNLSGKYGFALSKFLKQYLPSKTLEDLPAISDRLTFKPQSYGECQIACLMVPLCQAFIFLKETLTYRQGCYLLKKFPASVERISMTNNDVVILGLRLCPLTSFSDWDGDGIINIDDSCPLNRQNSRYCLCRYNKEASRNDDPLCGWKDLRKSTTTTIKNAIFSGGFDTVTSPRDCQHKCSNLLDCSHFTYSFLEGCFLFKGKKLVPAMRLGNQLNYGVVTGPSHCYKLPSADNPASSTRCRRENIAFEGILLYPTLEITSQTLCQEICHLSYKCSAWTFSQSPQRNCQLFFRLYSEKKLKGSISSPKLECGSCRIDTDGDLTYDCEDYCRLDPLKVFPGGCGCGRTGVPPKCYASEQQRSLMTTSLLDDTAKQQEPPSEFSFSDQSIRTQYPRQQQQQLSCHSVQNPQLPSLSVMQTCYQPNVIYNEDGESVYLHSRPSQQIEDEMTCHLTCQSTAGCCFWMYKFDSAEGCLLYGSRNNGEATTSFTTEIVSSGPKFCPGTCHDGLLNQDEEMIDCGGTSCPKCGTLCHDGIKNQNEDDIDCGGVCEICSCLKNNGGCHHYCIPFDNKPSCHCKPGYGLSSDNKTCEDVDECSLPISKACSPYYCRNLPGSFECFCLDGWTWERGKLYCEPPVIGPCIAKNVMIQGSVVFDRLFSPIDKNANIPIPTSVEECQSACNFKDDCHIWLFVERDIHQKNKEHQFLEKGCHLRKLGNGTQTKAQGVTSGHKAGDPNDQSCKSMISDLDFDQIQDIKIIELSPSDLDLMSSHSYSGSQLLIAWQLPASLIEKKPNLVKISIEILSNADRLDTLHVTPLLFEVPTGMQATWILTNDQRERRRLQEETLKRYYFRDGQTEIDLHDVYPREVRSLKSLYDQRSIITTPPQVVGPLLRAKIDLKRSNDLLKGPIGGCGILFEEDHKRAKCIFKTTGIPPNLIFQIKIWACHQSKVCGNPWISSPLLSNALEPPPIIISMNIARNLRSKHLEVTVRFEIKMKNKDWPRLIDSLRHQLKGLEVLSLTRSHLMSDTSTQFFIETHSNSSPTVWKQLSHQNIHDIISRESVFPLMIHSENQSYYCNNGSGMLSTRGFMLKFKESRCVRSVQFHWDQNFSPQLISMEMKKMNKQWDFIKGYENFLVRPCKDNRYDIFDFLQSTASGEGVVFKEMRFWFGHPCARMQCPQSFFVLKGMYIEECQRIWHRKELTTAPRVASFNDKKDFSMRNRFARFMLDSSSQSNPFHQKHALPLHSETSLDSPVWKWAIERYPFDTRGQVIDFRVNVLPLSISSLFELPKPMTIELTEDDLRNSGAGPFTWLPLNIGLGIAAFLSCLCVIFGARCIRKRRKKREDDDNNNTCNQTDYLVSRYNSSSEVTKCNSREHFISPSRTFHSILDAITGMLPTISEDPLEDVTRRSQSSFMSLKGFGCSGEPQTAVHRQKDVYTNSPKKRTAMEDQGLDINNSEAVKTLGTVAYENDWISVIYYKSHKQPADPSNALTPRSFHQSIHGRSTTMDKTLEDVPSQSSKISTITNTSPKKRRRPHAARHLEKKVETPIT